MEYLKKLVDEIHSVVLATTDELGHPQTRVVDMMYQDGKTVYFLTANTKPFYQQLKNNPYVAITGITQGKSSMDKQGISLSGRAVCIGKEKLPILLENNTYMYDIYPTESSRAVLEVFKITDGEGEFFDLTVLPPAFAHFKIG